MLFTDELSLDTKPERALSPQPNRLSTNLPLAHEKLAKVKVSCSDMGPEGSRNLHDKNSS